MANHVLNTDEDTLEHEQKVSAERSLASYLPACLLACLPAHTVLDSPTPWPCNGTVSAQFLTAAARCHWMVAYKVVGSQRNREMHGLTSCPLLAGGMSSWDVAAGSVRGQQHYSDGIGAKIPALLSRRAAGCAADFRRTAGGCPAGRPRCRCRTCARTGGT